MKKNIRIYQKFYEYFSILYKETSLNPLAVQKIFLRTLQDFFKNDIDHEMFSSVTSDLYYVFSDPKDYESNTHLQELGKALFDSTELNFYFINREDISSNSKIYNSQLKNIKTYFLNNKHLIINDKSRIFKK